MACFFYFGFRIYTYISKIKPVYIYILHRYLFQVKSLGALIDLRTLIHGLLFPPQIRIVINFAQKARSLYYHLRICSIFLEAYYTIRMIFSSAVLRIYTKEPKAKALRHVMVQNVLLKNLFGKIIQNSLKTSLEDLIKLTNR